MSGMKISRRLPFLASMKRIVPVFLLAYAISGVMPLSLHAGDYLKNTDFKEGFQMWRGDGRTVFLKPDGTEGDENDPGAFPVLKIVLAKKKARVVYQDYKTADNPNTQNIRVEVYASIDFNAAGLPMITCRMTIFPTRTSAFAYSRAIQIRPPTSSPANG